MRIFKKKPISKEDIWTEEEDKKLIDAYRFGGPFNWNHISEITGRDVFYCMKRFSILCHRRKDGRALMSTSFAPPPPTESPIPVPSPSATLKLFQTCLPPPKNENLKRKFEIPPQNNDATEEGLVSGGEHEYCRSELVLDSVNCRSDSEIFPLDISNPKSTENNRGKGNSFKV